MKTVRIITVLYFAFLATLVFAQEQRTLTETALPTWKTFTCSKNADDSIECSGCVDVIDSDGDKRTECSNTFRLAATVNQNRANALGDAVRNRALRRFGVDGGAP